MNCDLGETRREMIRLRNDEFAGEPTQAGVVFELFFFFILVLVYLVFEPVTAEVEVDLGLVLDNNNRRHRHRQVHRDQFFEDRRGRRPS